jgi:glycosyltransferase involved in cell wall biosynthesis
MKILYVHERFGALAGAEANAHITASELARRNHTVGILHGPGTGKNEESWKATFSERYELAGRKAAEAASDCVSAFKPDVIYIHKMPELEVLENLLESGVPVVRMVHDHDIYCMRSYKYNYFSREICHRSVGPHCVFPCMAFAGRNSGGAFPLKWVSYRAKKREVSINRRFARMLVVTEYMRQELLNNGFDSRKIEIHPPVPRMGDPNLRSEFSDRNLILYAGQIIRGKGVDVLIESLAMLRVKFECVILGDGNHRPYCERLCRKLALDGQVRFQGFVPQETLREYYRECSVVAISSVWPEPIATIGLEVMRYALPVVAFDAGGIKDWLIDGHNGFLVPWMDRRAYARRIEQLLADKALARQMGQNGLQLVSERYDFEAYIAGLEAMFKRVIAECQASRTCAK